MVSVPFYLVVLIELVLLESLAIAGFFVFRWWRERQDQVVLQALITATESSALARNHVLKAKLTELTPNAPELAEKAEQLLDAEVRFQKRLIAAFRHERLLSLGHLPLWTEELLVPYQALMDGVQSTLATSVREHQKEIERKVEQLNGELAHSKDEIQQTRQEIEALDRELTSTKEELAQKKAKVESLEREYESAFHHGYNNDGTAPQGENPPPGPSETAAATETAPPTAESETAARESADDDAIVIDNEEETPPEADTDLTIGEGDDEEKATGVEVEAVSQPQDASPDLIEAAVQQRAQDDTADGARQAPSEKIDEAETTAQNDEETDWEAAFAAQAAAAKASPDNVQADRTAVPDEKAQSGITVSEEEADADPDLDWGSALAEQQAENSSADDDGDAPSVSPESPVNVEETESAPAAAGEEDIDLDWGAALEEQAASGAAEEETVTAKTEPPVGDDATGPELTISDDEIDEDIDLDWGAALAEQSASEASADSEEQIKNAG